MAAAEDFTVKLSDELRLEIISYLPSPDVCSLRLACKAFEGVSIAEIVQRARRDSPAGEITLHASVDSHDLKILHALLKNRVITKNLAQVKICSLMLHRDKGGDIQPKNLSLSKMKRLYRRLHNQNDNLPIVNKMARILTTLAGLENKQKITVIVGCTLSEVFTDMPLGLHKRTKRACSDVNDTSLPDMYDVWVRNYQERFSLDWMLHIFIKAMIASDYKERSIDVVLKGHSARMEVLKDRRLRRKMEKEEETLGPWTLSSVRDRYTQMAQKKSRFLRRILNADDSAITTIRNTVRSMTWLQTPTPTRSETSLSYSKVMQVLCKATRDSAAFSICDHRDKMASPIVAGVVGVRRIEIPYKKIRRLEFVNMKLNRRERFNDHLLACERLQDVTIRDVSLEEGRWYDIISRLQMMNKQSKDLRRPRIHAIHVEKLYEECGNRYSDAPFAPVEGGLPGIAVEGEAEVDSFLNLPSGSWKYEQLTSTTSSKGYLKIYFDKKELEREGLIK